MTVKSFDIEKVSNISNLWNMSRCQFMFIFGLFYLLKCNGTQILNIDLREDQIVLKCEKSPIVELLSELGLKKKHFKTWFLFSTKKFLNLESSLVAEESEDFLRY